MFLSLPSIFGYLGKETKNTAEHVILLSFIYARPCVNKDFVHSGSIALAYCLLFAFHKLYKAKEKKNV